ncbi:hypothetical protein HNR76_000481 [Pseudoxanthomonas broegbernensis]|nr:hypothetical protein [Pseudoxanthomonas broegbernensis]
MADAGIEALCRPGGRWRRRSIGRTASWAEDGLYTQAAPQDRLLHSYEKRGHSCERGVAAFAAPAKSAIFHRYRLA